MKKLLGEERDKNLSKNLLVSNNLRTFVSARTRQASQRCSNVRVVLFLYMSVSYYSAPPPIEVTTHIHRGASIGS